ncbi:uncharacterized protein LOC120290475 [Eucalyptus grandis]|uniref:uncharacterized protein LOC120290475 n=1 Tax=Eucalyptus grandis TaxID=71139 RepID=UPI00192EB7A2|nr:uncharacterized protein LOC120290475 [Eucalyptus grandis]
MPSRHHLLCILSPSLSLVFFFFLLSFHGGHSAFPTICESQSQCGNVSIKYPFSTVSDAPVYCGYPQLRISCPYVDDPPTVSLLGDTYLVTEINYVEETLTLVDINVADRICTRASHNLTINSLPLGYNSADVNVTFFFNCSTPPLVPILARAIDCLRSGGKQSYVFVDMSPDKAAAIHEAWGCEEAVVAAVKRTEVTTANGGDELAGAMSEGFALDWAAVRECGACEHSGGRCAFNQNEQLLCFCEDGSNHTDGSFCKASSYFKPFRECVPYPCGDQEISYPFRHNERPSYCGYPGYELDCDGGNLTLLSMESLKYQVIHMDRSEQILKVARMDLLKDICLAAHVNTTLNCSLFNYTSIYLNSTLFYNCNSLSTHSDYWFSCPTSGDGCFAFDADRKIHLHEVCNFSVFVPIVPTEPLGLPISKLLSPRAKVLVFGRPNQVILVGALGSSRSKSNIILYPSASSSFIYVPSLFCSNTISLRMDLSMSCSSFSLLFFFISLHIQFPMPASGEFQPFQDCTPFDCGKQQISYPFRHIRRPSYCGYPGYELDCDGNYTTLSMESLKYRVIHIDWSEHVLEVARTDLWDDVCPRILVNTSLNFSLFNYTSRYFNSSLFYNCNLWPPQHYHWFHCPLYGLGYFALYADRAKPLHKRCNFSVLVPNSHSEAPGLAPPPEGSDHSASNAAISEFLSKGFEITSIVNTFAMRKMQQIRGKMRL